MIGAYLAAWGKAADLTTTAIGLYLSPRFSPVRFGIISSEPIMITPYLIETNPIALSPLGIILCLTFYPILLGILELWVEKQNVGWWRRLLILPGLLWWLPVVNNVWWILR